MTASTNLDDIRDRSREVMEPASNEKSGSTQSGGSPPEMDPVFLHPGDQSQGCHRDLVGFVSKLQLVGESHDVETRIHGRDVDTESLTQPEVSPAELIDVHLEDVAEVNQHVAGALRPAGDVQTGGDDVGALPAPGQVLSQGELEEVERHVDVIWPETQLLSQGDNFLPCVLKSDLPGLPANTGGVEATSKGVAPSLPVRRHESSCKIKRGYQF